MRALWLSRLCRPDLGFIIARLASMVTTWSRFEDKQLHRCIAYLHGTSDCVLQGEVTFKQKPIIEVYTRTRTLHHALTRQGARRVSSHVYQRENDRLV